MTFNMQFLGAPQGHSSVLPLLWYNRAQQISHIHPSLSTLYRYKSVCLSVRYRLVRILQRVCWCDRTAISKLQALWILEIIPSPMERGHLLYKSLCNTGKLKYDCSERGRTFWKYSERNTMHLFFVQREEKEINESECRKNSVCKESKLFFVGFFRFVWFILARWKLHLEVVSRA